MDSNLWYRLDRFPMENLPLNFNSRLNEPTTDPSWSEQQKQTVAKYLDLKMTWLALPMKNQEEMIEQWLLWRKTQGSPKKYD